MSDSPLYIRNLGRISYSEALTKMQAFTAARQVNTSDELWIVEHDPVYTLGLGADISHIHTPHKIPIVQTDRGGEVTYHGPGQVVLYLLLDLHRIEKRIFVHDLVFKLEQAAINVLNKYHIHAVRHQGAPGVYIANDEAHSPYQGYKIAALGLKINKKGYCYHGIALNVSMNLTPFTWIDPCGYTDLSVIDMNTLGIHCTLSEIQDAFALSIASELNRKVMIEQTC